MTDDRHLAAAIAQADRASADPALRPVVRTFFDEATFTASHVVHDAATRRAGIIDSVLDYDAASGQTRTQSAERIADYVEGHDLVVDWILETHVHADHLSAAPWLQRRLGGKIAIGRDIRTVQRAFAETFGEGEDFLRDGSQFDRLFADGGRFDIGALPAIALHVPGHTPADMAYLVGDALFVGDTLFMPDYGTARVDFPGGCATKLYRSIRRLMALPEATRVFVCHDYKAAGRDEFAFETTIGAERAGNIHIHDAVSEAAFVAMRVARDATLAMPALILPSIQVNMRGGRLPEPARNGVRYLKIPLDVFGTDDD